MPIREGQTATNAKGQTIVYKGGNWINVPAPGGPVVGKALTKEDRQALNNLNEAANAGGEVVRQFDEAVPIAKRLGTGQLKGMLMGAATQEDGGSIFHNLPAALIGGPLRAIGAISPGMDSDYQRLKAIQMKRVLAEQTLQKGVQTEGDAARIKQAGISPYNTPETFVQNAATGKEVAQRVQGRAQFYTKWANQYGLNATDPQGRGVEEAFQQSLAHPAPAAAATRHFVFDPASGKIVPK
jgi:hypothetical protein